MSPQSIDAICVESSPETPSNAQIRRTMKVKHVHIDFTLSSDLADPTAAMGRNRDHLYRTLLCYREPAIHLSYAQCPKSRQVGRVSAPDVARESVLFRVVASVLHDVRRQKISVLD